MTITTKSILNYYNRYFVIDDDIKLKKFEIPRKFIYGVCKKINECESLSNGINIIKDTIKKNNLNSIVIFLDLRFQDGDWDINSFIQQLEIIEKKSKLKVIVIILTNFPGDADFLDIPFNRFVISKHDLKYEDLFCKFKKEIKDFIISCDITDPFFFPYRMLKKMDINELIKLTVSAYNLHKQLINKEFEEKKADKIIFCGGKLVKTIKDKGKKISDDYLKSIGEKFGYIPFVFASPLIIEQMSCSWSKNKRNSGFYPTLSLKIDEIDKIKADFDTGAEMTLISSDIITPKRVASGIGKQKFFCDCDDAINVRDFFEVAIIDSSGNPIICNCGKEMEVCIVLNWVNSGFQRVTKDRQILCGRDILNKLPAIIILNPLKMETYVEKQNIILEEK